MTYLTPRNTRSSSTVEFTLSKLTKEYRFLVNTSGAGKTRLLYEGLCQNWGFYFTSAMDTNGLGSCDVQDCIDPDLPKFRGFQQRLPDSVNSPVIETILAHNLKATRRRFSEVLLARLLVFRLFLSTVHDLHSTLSEDHKRRWLMLQLCPILENDDICHVLSRYFQHGTDSYVDETTTRTLDEIRTTWDLVSDSPLHLFFAVDEANYSSQKFAHAFRDEHGCYPVLKTILSTWQERMSGIPTTFVVAGTQIPKHYFLNDEWKTARWISNTGAFTSQESHREYILRYLPKELSDSPSGRDLVSRAWDWCRGRFVISAPYLGVWSTDHISSLVDY